MCGKEQAYGRLLCNGWNWIVRFEAAEAYEALSCDSQWTGVNAQGGPPPRQRCLVGQTLIFLCAVHERIGGGDGLHGGVLNGPDSPLNRNLQHSIHGLDKMYRKPREAFRRARRHVLRLARRN